MNSEIEDVISSNIKTSLDELRTYRKAHIDCGKYMTSAGHIYLVDILAFACLNRSLQLLLGFCSLIEGKNFVSAAPLLRLQLDNYLRFFASRLAPDSHGFVREIINGVPVNRLKDRDNHLMSDRYLVKKVAEEHAWVSSVYEHTSGYVHLSDKHIYNAMDVSIDEPTFTLKISDEDEYIPDDSYIEAIEGFKATTRLLLELICDWAYSKNRHFKEEGQ